MSTPDDAQDLVDSTLQALRQEVPESLEWLFTEPIPVLHWQHDGTVVDPRVAKGWLVLANERANPEPSRKQRRQAQLFAATDHSDFAAWVLKAWVSQDEAVPHLSDARRHELRDLAEKAATLAKRLGRGSSDPEERYQLLLKQEANHKPPSAWPFRGLLALVKACGGHVPKLAASSASTKPS